MAGAEAPRERWACCQVRRNTSRGDPLREARATDTKDAQRSDPGLGGRDGDVGQGDRRHGDALLSGRVGVEAGVAR